MHKRMMALLALTALVACSDGGKDTAQSTAAKAPDGPTEEQTVAFILAGFEDGAKINSQKFIGSATSMTELVVKATNASPSIYD